MNKDEIKKDFLAFADDESDVIIEPNGDVLFYKNGTENLCKIITDCGITKVLYEDNEILYGTFIAKHLARLDIFAQKIKEKRKRIDEFIDGPAHLIEIYKREEGTALNLLQKECDSFLMFGSKINFITADAGHGKSALLKQFQYLQAERFLKNEANYLFWHIDLQGRDLVRLGEAIMYDLGELRMPGLYFPSIINLIQKKYIILAIDGFDELAAEIGGNNAVSSLSNFVNEMNGKGTLICASRRTFFDTHDYLKKTNLIKGDKTLDIIFNEIKLKDWTEIEVVKYFDYFGYDDSDKVYKEIFRELKDPQHPILTRPFLLSKLVQALDYDTSIISGFFSQEIDGSDGVSLIVESFMKREVDKWRDRNGIDQETGKPYLTYDQHIQLLSSFAREMWESQKEFITKEEIELYTIFLLEEWSIPEDLKKTIVRIVTSHAFLIPIQDDRIDARKFDHEEFQHYFLGRALAELIEKGIKDSNSKPLRKFLYVDQLPDSVASYCFDYMNNKTENAGNLLKLFAEIIGQEWKPTYLQVNIGTLIPYLLNNLNNETIFIDFKVNYSSLVFENKTIRNVIFANGEFINISLRNTKFETVEFVNCNFNEIKFYNNTNHLYQVKVNKSNINSIIIIEDDDEIERAFSPERINELILKLGVLQDDHIEDSIKTMETTSMFKKKLMRFLLKYNKLTVQYEMNIKKDKYLGYDTDDIIENIIPILEKHKIIEKIDTKASRQMKSQGWRLVVDIEDLLKNDKNKNKNSFFEFWEEINSIKD